MRFPWFLDVTNREITLRSREQKLCYTVLSPIKFSDKCCGKFSVILTKCFKQVTLQKCVSRFFKKREEFIYSAEALNKTKRGVVKLQQHFGNTVHFFHSANSLTLITVCIKNRLS